MYILFSQKHVIICCFIFLFSDIFNLQEIKILFIKLYNEF